MPPPRPSVCTLVSGGMDSAMLLERLLQQGARVRPLYVRVGLRWEAAEMAWLRRFLNAMRHERLRPLRIVDLPLRPLYARSAPWSVAGRAPAAGSDDRDVFLPGRNVLLTTTAAIVCAQEQMSSIALGVLQGNPFGDAAPQFFQGMAGCLSRALSRPLRILTPLRRLRKAELLRQPTTAPLALTFSCLRPRGLRHCGRCNKCAERRQAFRAAGITDPTPYAC